MPETEKKKTQRSSWNPMTSIRQHVICPDSRGHSIPITEEKGKGSDNGI